MATFRASSMATASVLLVVAVMLIGSTGTTTAVLPVPAPLPPPSPSPPGNNTVEILNLCGIDLYVVGVNSVAALLVKFGGFVGIDLEFLKNPAGPLFIRKDGVLYLIPPGFGPLGTTGILYKVDIVCDDQCGNGILTIYLYFKVSVLGGTITPPPVRLCLDAVIPASSPSTSP